jgi:hypothetical protein
MTRSAGIRLLSISLSIALAAAAAGQQKEVRYNISGRVLQLEANHHATVHVNGPSPHSTTTRNDGTWEVLNVKPGVYNLHVTHSLYTFTPASREVTVRTSDVHNITFTAHRKTESGPGTTQTQVRHLMNGHVYGLQPGHHATIHAHGPTTRTATTLSDGTWEMKNMAPGVYTVNATRANYTITPDHHTVDVGHSDRHEINFNAHLQTATKGK